MAIVKVIEVISEGTTVDAAIKAAVAEVGKTVTHITQVNVDHITGIVEENKITKIRVHAKVSFVVEKT